MPTIPHLIKSVLISLLITNQIKSMKKNNCIDGKAIPFRRWKIFLIMKLLCVFILGFMIQTYAVVSYAQTRRLNLQFQDNSLKEVLQILEDQTDFSFIYKDELIDSETRITGSFKETSITEVLQHILQKERLTYTIKGKAIVILPNDQEVNVVQKNLAVSGKVTDSSGTPLPGVTVIVRGTTTGTVTDVQGSYRLTSVPDNAILVFSFIGMKMQELAVAGKQQINVVLEEETIGIEEVVAVGYSVQKKANLTGSVATIGENMLENRPVTNSMAALQGAAPGLVVTRNSGQPGNEEYKMNIRGFSSVNGTNQALVIIDGVEGDMTLLNSNDIESISILKDAAAASIYGAKAANGVIIVTTKKGTKGKTVISYTGLMTLNHAYSIPERLHSWEESEMANLSRLNAGLSRDYTDEEIEWMKDPDINYAVNPTNPNTYKFYYDLNQVEMLMREITHSQNHNVSVKGGNEGTQYLLSLGYYDQNGVFEMGPDGTTRNNVRLNLNTRFNKIFSLDSRIAYNQDRTMSPSQSVKGDYGLLYNIYQLRTRFPIFLPESDDTKYATSAAGATYATLKEGGYHEVKRKDIGGVFTLKAENIIDGLTLRLVYSPALQLKHDDTFYRRIPQYDRRPDPVTYWNNPNSIIKRRSTTVNNEVQALADYDWSISSDHHFHVLGGFQYHEYDYNYTSAQAKSLTSNDVPSLNLGGDPSVPPIVWDDIQTNAMVSYFGRLNYNYKDKYLFEANIRNDASSKLAPGHRSKTFPSFSAGWNMSREPWFNNALPFFSEFKLRGSWGKLGNADVLGNYDYISVLEGTNSSGNPIYYPFNNVKNNVLYQKKLASKEKTWETLRTVNGGIDLGMLDQRLTASFDYFVRKNENMLVNVTLPATLGVTPSATNSAELKSWGWEATLGWKDMAGNLKYWINLNVSDNKDKVVKYAGQSVYAEGLNKVIEGLPLNTIWGYQADGYFSSPEEVAEAPFQDARTGAGDIRYKNLDDSEKIDGGLFRPDDHGDLVNLGTTSPRYLFGATLGFEWKGIDFSAFFQGVAKRNILMQPQVVVPFADSWRQPWKIHTDYWTEDNPDARFPRLYQGGSHNTRTSSHWVQDAGYIRLKNLQVGYTFPARWTSKIMISKARVFFTGQDLWEHSKMWFKYYDPENPNSTSFNYPFFRSYAVGLNVTF